MKVKYLRIVSFPTYLLGNSRSMPAEIGSACPTLPVVQPRPLEHPESMSLTVQVGFPPMEPVNDSTLAIECPPESPAGQAAENPEA